jgi:phosphatidylglycerol:prolipoprotein diacylglycerol transferase
MGLVEGWDPIKIGINPEIGSFGGLLLTWHGVFVAVGIAVGVWVAVQFAKRVGIIEDDAYGVALVAVICGIIGARALYVIENYGDPGSGLHSVGDIFRINEGGISIYGAVIGGVLGGVIYNRFGLWMLLPIVPLWYLLWRAMGKRIGGPRLPMLPGLDAGALGLILGMGIGRIGDIINGEHLAKTTDLPWAVIYTNSNSLSFGRDPQHPAVAYELIGDLLIFLLLLGLWRIRKRDGLVFFSFAFLYSIMRLGVSALRLDPGVWGELRMAQIVALFVIAISVVGLAYCARRGTEVMSEAAPAVAEAAAPAAGRQRR